MPYPYSNDLGKKPPETASYKNEYTVFPVHHYPKPKKVPESFQKPMTQQEMLEKLYGAKPGTLKFPGVVPLAVTKDYPGSHPANKWGKPDPNSIPDDKTDALAKEAQEFIAKMSAGIISKEEAYAQLYGKANPVPIWDDHPSLPQPSKPTTMAQLDGLLKEVYEQNLPTTWGDYEAKLKAKVYGEFPGIKAPQSLVKMLDWYDPSSMSQKIQATMKIEGLGIGGIKFGTNHILSQYAANQMNTDMLSAVLDETFDKLKQEILKAVIKRAGENGS